MFSKGQRIAGRYDLIRRIGSGGTASVYLARDTVLGRDVAVKLLHPDVASDPVFVERLRREAQAAASPNDPNIAAVYDWGRSDDSAELGGGVYYMVMEYVPGRNLKELLADGAISESDALTVAIKVASALASAHQKGVIHRDIKPQNILLSPDEQIKVVDFGIARALGVTQLTRTNVVPGTPYYVAPEQVTSHKVDARSDVYSLGVVLYEMVTGAEPFQGSSLVEVALKHVNEQPVPPRRLVPALSPQTESIILKALAKQPGGRYQSAEAMKDALKAALYALEHPSSNVPQTAPTSPAEVLSDPQTPTRTIAASARVAPHSDNPYARWLLAIPVLLLLAVAAGTGLYLRSNSGQPTRHSAAVGANTHRVNTTPTPAGSKPPAHHRASLKPTATPLASHATGGTRQASPFPTLTATAAQVATTAPTAAPVIPPTSVALVASNVFSQPSQAVRAFYNFVSNHEWDNAAALWTPGLRSRDDPFQFINVRFQGTASIDVQNAEAQNEDVQAGTAAVAVDLVEHLQNGDDRSLSGTWYLVRRSAGWYLDHPDIHYND